MGTPSVNASTNHLKDPSYKKKRGRPVTNRLQGAHEKGAKTTKGRNVGGSQVQQLMENLDFQSFGGIQCQMPYVQPMYYTPFSFKNSYRYGNSQGVQNEGSRANFTYGENMLIYRNLS